jgi:hypothetical protein
MMTLMAEFIAKSAIGRDAKPPVEEEEADSVADSVAVAETDTNLKIKTIPRRGGLFFLLKPILS